MNIPDDLFHKVSSLLFVIKESCRGCYYTASSKCRGCFAVPAKALHREMSLSRSKCRLPKGIAINAAERIVLRHIRDNGSPCVHGVKIPGVEAYEKRRALRRLLGLKLITAEAAGHASVNKRFEDTINQLLATRAE